MNLRRLLAVSRKEVIQLRRDLRSLLLAFFLPLLLVAFFGFAITLDVKNIHLAVLDYDNSAISRDLVQAFESSGYFERVVDVTRYGDIEHEFLSDRSRLALVIPVDFGTRFKTGRAPVQLMLDGGDANTATIALNYAEAIIARFQADYALNTGRTRFLPIDPRVRVWYNESLLSQNMVVPGLIAVIMSIIAAMLTALTIAREWERGSMEQLASTPASRVEIVLGKLLPYVGIGMIDVAGATLVGLIVFHVPLRGNVFLLAALSLLFLVGVLGFGLFISATLKSQVMATQVAIMTTYLPALLLSGFLFAISSMPAALRLITYIVPARYFVTVTRGIFLKDVGVNVLWLQALAMVIFATLGLALAIKNFKKELA